MFNYFSLLCALAVVTVLIQFQAYYIYRNSSLDTDISDLIGLPIETVFECERTAEA